MPTFEDENDVRKWLRTVADASWWVEPRHGGTAGFPDSVCVFGGAPVFLELKLARQVDAAEFVFEASPSQILVLRQMNEAGLDAYVLAGIKGTSCVGVRREGFQRLGESKAIGGRKMYGVRGWDHWWDVETHTLDTQMIWGL